MNSKKKIGYSAGIISGVSYGTFGVFQTILLGVGTPEFVLVALPAFVLTMYFGIRVLFKIHVMKTIPLKIYILLAAQGGVCATMMNYSYTMAYSMGMPVGVVSIVAFCNVLVVMILSVFVLKYRITLPKIIAIAVAVFGVSLVIGIVGGNANVGVYSVLGLMWTILIPIFYGISIVINSYALSKGTDSDACLLIAQFSSMIVVFAIMINPVLFFQELFSGVGGGAEFWIGLIGFCLISQIFCYAAMQESLKRIDPTIYQIMMSLDPITALILGVVVMSQAVTGLQIVGIIIVLAAVVFIAVMDGRMPTPTDTQKAETDPSNAIGPAGT